MRVRDRLSPGGPCGDEVRDYVESVRALDPNCRALTEGLNAEKLIPDIRARIARQR
jgi:hypothetical protein